MTQYDLPARPVHWADRVLGVLLGILLLSGLFGGFYLYRTTRAFVAESRLPIFPAASSAPAVLPTAASLPPPSAEGEESASASPDPAPAATSLPAAPGSSQPQVTAATQRLTVLVMGIDRREGEEGPWRTDSMILISVDPATQSVAMLSMPRDLFITMPDYGEGEYLDRINLAYFRGDAEKYPGGGPALAKQTIRRNFGVKVDRYLVMDFDGFRRVIDEIGGVEIDVPELLIDDQYPTEDYGTMVVRFEPGAQIMDGERALIYSRTRKSTSDFARAERQQEVILAVRNRVLSLDIIPSLTPARVGRLIATLDDSIETDLTLEEFLALVQVAQDIKTRNIRRAVVDSTMVLDYTTSAGAQVLLPKWDEVLPLVEETFDIELLAIAPTPVPPPTPLPSERAGRNGGNQGGDVDDGEGTGGDGDDPVAVTTPIPEEVPQPALPVSGSIQVLNGTARGGLEETIARDLRQGGYNVVGSGMASSTDYGRTLILLYNEGARAIAEALQSRYQLAPGSIRLGDPNQSGPDIVIILGGDIAATAGGGR